MNNGNPRAGTREWLQSLSPEAYWQLLVAAGWTNLLTAEQSASLQKQIIAAFEQDPLTAWELLPAISFDSETIYDATADGLSYPSIAKDLAEVTNGLFAPREVSGYSEGDNWHVNFVVGDRKYSFTASTTTDYFDIKFLGVVNQALKDEGHPYQFIVLPSADQIVHLAFVQPQTVERTVQQGLIPALDFPS